MQQVDLFLAASGIECRTCTYQQRFRLFDPVGSLVELREPDDARRRLLHAGCEKQRFGFFCATYLHQCRGEFFAQMGWQALP